MWSKDTINSIYNDFREWCLNQMVGAHSTFYLRDLQIYFMMIYKNPIYEAKKTASQIILAFKKYKYVKEYKDRQYEFTLTPTA